jgi:hypothetical protein
VSEKFKVRHSILNYHDGDGNPVTAFRNMTVELFDEKEIERFKRLGAVIPPDEELQKPGRMMALPETAADEEILNWVADAQASEVRQLILDRPHLADRIRAAAEVVKERFRIQEEQLSGVVKQVEEFEAEIPEDQRKPQPAPGSADPGAPPTPPAPGTQQINPPGGTGEPQDNGDGGSGDGGSVDPDEVVKGSVAEVSKYLSEHPTEAPMVLEAENRRVEAARAAGKADEQPRAGLVRAVQAASAHTAQ